MSEPISHFGVKGMKWGHKKQKQLDTYSRVASGKGKALDILKVVGTTSLFELGVRGGSYRKVAARRAAGLQKQKDRIESGKATVLDKLDRALNTSIIDLARGR